MLFLLAVLGLAACADTASPTTSASRLENAVSDHQRLKRVSYHLLRGAAGLCGAKVRSGIGLVTATVSSFDGGMRKVARAVFGVDERLRVIYVVPGSAADAAGLMAGDAIVRVNGTILPSGEAANGILHQRLDASRGRSVVLTVWTAGGLRDLALEAETVCDIPVEMVQASEVNAWADTGGTIEVSRGAIRFVRTDSELALLLSHEIGHIIMNHAGSYLGYMAAPQKFEAEADYVGLYVMARAGYNLDDGLRVMHRMANSFEDINNTPTHPATKLRFRSMRRVIDEIRSKIASNRPLDPDVTIRKSD